MEEVVACKFCKQSAREPHCFEVCDGFLWDLVRAMIKDIACQG